MKESKSQNDSQSHLEDSKVGLIQKSQNDSPKSQRVKMTHEVLMHAHQTAVYLILLRLHKQNQSYSRK